MKAETKISERRACILVGIDRLTFRYQPQIRDDAGLWGTEGEPSIASCGRAIVPNPRS